MTELAWPHRGHRGRALDVALAGARPALTALPLVAVALLVLDATVLLLPHDPLVWRLTLPRLVVLAGFAAVLASGARLRHLRTRLDLPIGVLVLSGVLTTVLGRHDAAPLRALLTGVAFYYLCVAVLRTDPAAGRALVGVALVTAVIAGAVALAQVQAGTSTGFCRSLSLRDVSCRSGGLVRATGTFPNPNLLAAAVVLLAPIGALAARGARQRGERAVLLLLLALPYAGLLVTYSRGAYLAAAAGAVGLGLVHLAGGRGRRRAVTVTLGLISLLLGLAAAILLVSGAGPGVRGQLWGAALRAAGAHTQAGVGLGRAGQVISAAVPGPREFAHAHNLWLHWFLETGLLGLLGALLLTGLALLTAARLAARASAVGSAALAALTGFFVLSLTDHPANSSRIATLLWFVLALTMSTVTPTTRTARLHHRTAPHPVGRADHQPAASELGHGRVAASPRDDVTTGLRRNGSGTS